MTDRTHLRLAGWIAKIASVGLLAYWSLFALIAPVTIWDSQVYNLGRLPIAESGGLFNNPGWTSERQLVFPWTFDAIHLPFLHLGWGFGLPSFLCFLGVLLVAWSLLRRWHDATTAWVGCLTLLGLPTLVYQGVSTKNDIPILFGIAVWLHALLAWKDSSRRHHLLLSAVALGFAAGAKTSGLVPAALCACVTLVLLRRDLKAAAVFSGALFLALFFLGSGETYVEAYRKYGTPLGSVSFVQANRNNDGARGATANAIRYAMGNLDLGVEIWQKPDRVTPIIEDSCRKLLAATGLSDAGHRRGAGDAEMRFLKTGYDSASDYGPLGTACMLVMFSALLWWRPREYWWQLSIFAGVIVASICFSVAWMPWNNRFLMLPFAALAIALVSIVRQYSGPRRWPLLLLALASSYTAIAYPLLSFNKRPQDLADSVFHRQAEELNERSTMAPLMAAVREWHAAHPEQDLWVLAGSDSWILPFFYDRTLRVHIVNSTDLPVELANTSPARPPILLVLNRPDFKRGRLPLRLLQRFPDESGSGLYQVSTLATAAPAIVPGTGLYPDGWTGCSFTVGIENWRGDATTVEVWNPTPLKRAVSLKSASDAICFDLEPQQRSLVQIHLREFDSIEGTVSPGFLPGGPETRTLGIHFDVVLP